jgi:hypothetical protein
LDKTDKPEFTIQPNGTTEVVESENVTFTCVVDGKPSPTIQWLKNNAKLNVTGHSRLNISSGGTVLSITGVVRGDKGNYSCNATNKVDSVVSSSAQLVVNCKYNEMNCLLPVCAALVENTSRTSSSFIVHKMSICFINKKTLHIELLYLFNILIRHQYTSF